MSVKQGVAAVCLATLEVWYGNGLTYFWNNEKIQ